ncbi:MAG TPA: hypothetical protein VE982_06480 [Gaiellaceae bacterium]|nr:hypothetical protein [Gaiellaceae bacterium]
MNHLPAATARGRIGSCDRNPRPADPARAVTPPQRRTILLLAAVAALALPAVASAHAGKSPPVATNFQAHISHPVPGITAKVVDGDQTLWLNAGRHRVAITGIEEEPLLRFDPQGVWVNLRSLTAQTDRIDRFDLRPDPNPNAPPLWHKLTAGHAYAWHEHRLHLLEPLAKHLDEPQTLGTWTVPLLVDGRQQTLGGSLHYEPPPSAFTWAAVAAVLAALGLLAARRSSRTTLLLAPAAVLVVWILRVSRELYGRPTVGAVGWLQVALTSLIGFLLLYGLLHRDQSIRVFIAFLAAFGTLYQGFTMYPILTRAISLTLLPTSAARIGVTLAFALGAATLAGSWSRMTIRQNTAHDDDPLDDQPAQDEVVPPHRRPVSGRENRRVLSVARCGTRWLGRTEIRQDGPGSWSPWTRLRTWAFRP